MRAYPCLRFRLWAFLGGLLWLLCGGLVHPPALASEPRTSLAMGFEQPTWSPETTPGWKFRDATRDKHDGRIELRDGLLSMEDHTQGKINWCEAAYEQRISVPERFILEFRARFEKLGLTDESTGHLSTIRLQFGLHGPHGPVPLNLNYSLDRYNLASRTKVLRTNQDWHVWRLEVDSQRKTVALFRDGEYLCLHDFDGSLPPGIRIQVQGEPEHPAAVQISKISIRPAPLIAPSSPSPLPAWTLQATHPGDWPSWRRDPELTGISPLKGQPGSIPQEIGSVRVGSDKATPIWMDLDADGTVEALISHRGNLTAWKIDGQPAWDQRLESATIYGLHDLDADGQNDLILTAGNPSRMHVLDPRTGHIKFLSPEFPEDGVGAIRIARLNPDLKGLQAVVWSHMHEIGYCLSFAHGVERGKVEWRFDWKKTFFTPLVALADMDRDGDVDLVTATYDHVFVFDGRTGKLILKLEWHCGRNYGSIALCDLDADGFPEIVILASQLREHIAVIHNERGQSLKLLWDRFYEQNYPHDFVTLRILTNGLDDYDGDGRIELAYAVYDERTDRQWHTLIVDPLTGTTKADLPNKYLVGAGVIGDKRPVLFLSSPRNRQELQLTAISGWRGGTAGWQEFSPLPTGNVLNASTLLDFTLDVWSQESGIRNGFPHRFCQRLPGEDNSQGVLLQRPSGGTLDLLTWQADRGWTPRWSWPGGGQSTTSATEIVWVNRQDQHPHLVRQDESGRLQLCNTAGQVTRTIDPQSGALTIPVVARLRSEQPPSVLFFDARGNLQCHRADQLTSAGKPTWTHVGVGIWSMYTPLSQPRGIPLAVNVDRDADLEILIAQPPNQLIALNADGHVERTWTFPALPQQWSVANLDGDLDPDLLVTYPVGAIIDVDTVAVSGRNGATLWKCHCGNGPIIPVDLNQDGIHDLLTRDLYERRTLDGRTGRDLLPILMQAGYHTPMVVPHPSSAVPESMIWGGGGYSLGVESATGAARWWHFRSPIGSTGLAQEKPNSWVVAGMTSGQIYSLPDLKPLTNPRQSLDGFDLLTGEHRWSYTPGSSIFGLSTADVDGDGSHDFLVARHNGVLTAIHSQRGTANRVIWEHRFKAALGVPIVCDLQGDGSPEIVVSCADGRLHLLSLRPR